MTNEEAQRAFEALRSLVAESPLAWVLANVDDEIQRGKPGTRSLEKTGQREAVFVDGSLSPATRKSRYEEFTTVSPFEPAEQLDLLTTAVERVLREIPELQVAAAHAFGEFGAREITFAGDASDRAYSLTPISGIEDVSARLKELLVQFER
jgi:hypothetical protein